MIKKNFKLRSIGRQLGFERNSRKMPLGEKKREKGRESNGEIRDTLCFLSSSSSS
jgi:hypothetical protein